MFPPPLKGWKGNAVCPNDPGEKPQTQMMKEDTHIPKLEVASFQMEHSMENNRISDQSDRHDQSKTGLQQNRLREQSHGSRPVSVSIHFELFFFFWTMFVAEISKVPKLPQNLAGDLSADKRWSCLMHYFCSKAVAILLMFANSRVRLRRSKWLSLESLRRYLGIGGAGVSRLGKHDTSKKEPRKSQRFHKSVWTSPFDLPAGSFKSRLEDLSQKKSTGPVTILRSIAYTASIERLWHRWFGAKRMACRSTRHPSDGSIASCNVRSFLVPKGAGKHQDRNSRNLSREVLRGKPSGLAPNWWSWFELWTDRLHSHVNARAL